MLHILLRIFSYAWVKKHWCTDGGKHKIFCEIRSIKKRLVFSSTYTSSYRSRNSLMCEEESFLAQCSFRLSLVQGVLFGSQIVELKKVASIFLIPRKSWDQMLVLGTWNFFSRVGFVSAFRSYECFDSFLPVNFFPIWFNLIETWLSNRRARLDSLRVVDSGWLNLYNYDESMTKLTR